MRVLFISVVFSVCYNFTNRQTIQRQMCTLLCYGKIFVHIMFCRILFAILHLTFFFIFLIEVDTDLLAHNFGADDV